MDSSFNEKTISGCYSFNVLLKKQLENLNPNHGLEFWLKVYRLLQIGFSLQDALNYHDFRGTYLNANSPL